MTNPFPGVDPYIEAQGHWPDFHARFITHLCDELGNRLPDRYEAVIDEQFQLFQADLDEVVIRPAEPDVAVVRTSGRPYPSDSGPISTALLEPVTVTVFTEEVTHRHSWIEVRRSADRKVVTVIELLSPTNKSGKGRQDYLRKRNALFQQPVHLVEIDLLIDGPRLPTITSPPTGDCLAMVARVGRRPKADVYAWSNRRPLPTLPIPLSEPDPDVPLDLAAAYSLTYERSRIGRRLRHGQPLTLSLAASDRSWAESFPGT